MNEPIVLNPEGKPLFIALHAQHYREFELGVKVVEYRLYGPRWNEKVCVVGREVTLSYGYTLRRMRARIRHFEKQRMDTQTYGRDQLIACIHVELDRS